MQNYTTVNININSVKHGDTVIHDGKMHTVTRGNIKHSGFMGTTLYGDSYNLGHKPVKLVVFSEPVKCDA